MSTPVTQDRITRVIKESGWSSVGIETGCEPVGSSDTPYLCPMRGFVDQYEVVIYANNNSPVYNSPSVSLFME